MTKKDQDRCVILCDYMLALVENGDIPKGKDWIDMEMIARAMLRDHRLMEDNLKIFDSIEKITKKTK